MLCPRIVSALSALVLLGAAAPALAGSSQPVRVVELFTSQGCSSCPPANAFVAKLAASDPDALALSYGVTYWDYLGWEDTFGDPRFTERQRQYRDSLPSQMYTPQIVVNGADDAPRWKHRDLREHALDTAAVEVRDAGGQLAVHTDLPPGVRLALVSYTPGAQTVAVKRGENGGRTLALANVVDAIAYADWAGQPVRIDRPAAALAVLVHDARSGKIIAAADWRPDGDM